MKSTFEPGPMGRRCWNDLPAETRAEVMVGWHAGWFLDLPDGLDACKEGREEQQFPEEVYASAEDWYQNTDYLGGIQPGVEGVFAFEHFSRFETANRVWPPLVPATYWCTYFGHDRGEAVGAEHAAECDNSSVLTYRRDYGAPTPGHVMAASFVYGELVPGSSGNPAARRENTLVWEPRHCTV